MTLRPLLFAALAAATLTAVPACGPSEAEIAAEKAREEAEAAAKKRAEEEKQRKAAIAEAREKAAALTKGIREANMKAKKGEIAPLPVPEGANPALLDPSLATETAPDTFKVRFTTTQGDVVFQVHRAWAPHGADRFYNLVKIGYFDGVRFFRVVDDFMAQFGINPYGAVNDKWKEARIPPDPVDPSVASNTRGKLTFAMAGSPDTRSTQLFINYKDNARLDGMGFAPIGEVVEGMEVVDSLHKGYGDGPPRGNGPMQNFLQELGNAYLDAGWPELDGIEKATLVE